jgi:hypothetical protein
LKNDIANSRRKEELQDSPLFPTDNFKIELPPHALPPRSNYLGVSTVKNDFVRIPPDFAGSLFSYARYTLFTPLFQEY